LATQASALAKRLLVGCLFTGKVIVLAFISAGVFLAGNIDAIQEALNIAPADRWVIIVGFALFIFVVAAIGGIVRHFVVQRKRTQDDPIWSLKSGLTSLLHLLVCYYPGAEAYLFTRAKSGKLYVFAASVDTKMTVNVGEGLLGTRWTRAFEKPPFGLQIIDNTNYRTKNKNRTKYRTRLQKRHQKRQSATPEASKFDLQGTTITIPITSGDTAAAKKFMLVMFRDAAAPEDKTSPTSIRSDDARKVYAKLQTIIRAALIHE
jgi:hypothetical protein